MIILHISGGLGNQMFQYAFGRALAQRLGCRLLLDPSRDRPATYRRFQLHRVFSISAPVATASELKQVLGWRRHGVLRAVVRTVGAAGLLSPRYVEEQHFHFAPRMLQFAPPVYLRGYWQSEQYFSDAAASIRAEFAFRDPLSDPGRDLVGEMHGKTTAVSLHVRRGDYVTDPATSRRHGTCSLEYYRAAVDYLAARVPRPCFYVFSDDMAWARAKLRLTLPHLFVDHNEDGASHEDMHLMSLCRHHITANSSFSWWGAWLNPDPGKIVVAPAKWFAGETDVKDLLPAEWVTLPD